MKQVISKFERNSFVKIGIIGMGLIGGSLVKSLKIKGGFSNLSAYDIDEKIMEQAYKEEFISSYSTDINFLSDRDIIFVCVPPRKTFNVINLLYPWYKGLVCDVSSVKSGIYKAVSENCPDLRYLSVHPMAGSEKFGYYASSVSLFENAPFLICTTKAKIKNYTKTDIEILTEVAKTIGSRPILMDISRHDETVGMISHLPHVVAYALVKFIADSGDDVLKEIAAGGFRDITRIASSDPGLWADIITESDYVVAGLIKGYIEILKELSLTVNQRDDLLKIFSEAKNYRDNMLGTGGKREFAQIWVDVDDRPGIIGKIAVILGENNINIKNINIQDNREYEGGCMRITLSSPDDAVKAEKILEKEKLKVKIVR